MLNSVLVPRLLAQVSPSVEALMSVKRFITVHGCHSTGASDYCRSNKIVLKATTNRRPLQNCTKSPQISMNPQMSEVFGVFWRMFDLVSFLYRLKKYCKKVPELQSKLSYSRF
jgi:hypothetical protein